MFDDTKREHNYLKIEYLKVKSGSKPQLLPLKFHANDSIETNQ
jgi:hypothetical protein